LTVVAAGRAVVGNITVPQPESAVICSNGGAGPNLAGPDTGIPSATAEGSNASADATAAHSRKTLAPESKTATNGSLISPTLEPAAHELRLYKCPPRNTEIKR
jgi:hypothetical protein